MARVTNTTRGRKANQKHTSLDLLQKLEFVAQAQQKDGGYESHCIIRRGRIIGSNGVFTIGAKIDEEFEACPHTFSFIKALERCNETVGIVADDRGISVVSGKLTVAVQTCPIASMPEIEPDRQIAPLDNRLKKAFEVVGVLAKEGEARLPLATLYLEANFVTSTNGYAAMQYRHGIDLPPGLVIPKKFADMVVKHKANLSGFGWNQDTSVTFWFDDDTFIKTQLQVGQWPDVWRVLNVESNPWPIPEGFAEAVATVSKFTDGIIEMHGDRISSDSSKATVASFECEGAPIGVYNGKYLTAMLPFIETMDMKSYENRLVFFGCEGNMRGVIAGIKV